MYFKMSDLNPSQGATHLNRAFIGFGTAAVVA
jgi:hypothetical protein